MKSKMIAILLAILLVGVVSVGTARAEGSPYITVSPSDTLKKGTTITVNGFEFPINSTARIDLMLPNGNTVEGISTASVNATGKFTTSFICPDQNGDGYIRVVDGSVIVSYLVHFEGTKPTPQELKVSMIPNMIYNGQTTHITVLADFLTDKNYVVDFLVTSPTGQDISNYYVLHNGKLEFDYIFNTVGYYWLNLSVESTESYYSQYLEVKQNPNTNPIIPTENITISWEVNNVGNVFSVMLWKEGYGYISSGNITVRAPDGKTTSVQIKNSVATVTAGAMGVYSLKYVYGGKQYTSSFDYTVTIYFTNSDFDEDGYITLTLMIDGVAPTSDYEVNVSGAKRDTLTLIDGTADFTATAVGDYTFQTNVMGITKTTKATYTDTYLIGDVTANILGDSIVVTGSVIGQKTQSAGSNKQVQISIPSQGNYKETITTMADGSFETIVPIADKGGIGGIDVQIKATIINSGIGIMPSTNSKTATIHLAHDILGEFGWVFILLAIVIVLVGWKWGWWYKATKGKYFSPPRGKGGGDDEGDDDETY